MKHSKDYYKSIKYNGFKWIGFWDGYHHFSKEKNRKYLTISCIEKDIEDKSIYFMMDNHFSRK